MTLIEFLTARLDEDELVARSCATERWTVKDGWHDGLDMEVLSSTYPACIEPEEATHTARHDPARVLAEVEAKRRIVDAAQRNPHAPWDAYAIGRDDLGRRALRALALPYADHPDFDEGWRP